MGITALPGICTGAIVKKAKRVPTRALIHAIGGWGKTSFAAQAPDPIFLLVGKEDGLLTLQSQNQLPDDIPWYGIWPNGYEGGGGTPRTIQSKQELLSALDDLSLNTHGYKTVVIDSATEIHSIFRTKTCNEQFKGKWGDDGFEAFGRGEKVTANEWDDVLARLDNLRSKGITSFVIAHTAVKGFRNPSDKDYDRWQMDMAKEAAEKLFKWSDMTLFGNFEVAVEAKGKATKGKAIGGSHRIIHTTHNAAWDAKNRHGLPDEIDGGNSPQEAWRNFAAALIEGMKKNQTQPEAQAA